VQRAVTGNNEQGNNNKQLKKSKEKNGFGYTLGVGLNQSKPTYSGNANTGITGVQTAGAAITMNAGIIYQFELGGAVAIRPATTIGFENTEIAFYRRSGTGGPVITEKLMLKNTMISIAAPVIIRLTAKKTKPYISLGPSFSYLFSQDNNSADKLPVKKSVLTGTAGVGVDLGLGRSGFIISPELNYAIGLSDMKDNASSSNYALAVSSLKKETFSLHVYLKKK